MHPAEGAVLAGAAMVGLAYQRQPESLTERKPALSFDRLSTNRTYATLALLCILTRALLPDGLPNEFPSALALSRVGLAHGFVFEFITHAFVHASLAHLVGNLTMLLVLAAQGSRLNPRATWHLFLVGSALSGVASVISSPALIVGASGGLAAIGGAQLTQWREITTTRRLAVVLVLLVGVYVVTNLDPQVGPHESVDHLGHAVGFIFGLSFNRQRSWWRRRNHLSGSTPCRD